MWGFTVLLTTIIEAYGADLPMWWSQDGACHLKNGDVYRLTE